MGPEIIMILKHKHICKKSSYLSETPRMFYYILFNFFASVQKSGKRNFPY